MCATGDAIHFMSRPTGWTRPDRKPAVWVASPVVRPDSGDNGGPALRSWPRAHHDLSPVTISSLCILSGDGTCSPIRRVAFYSPSGVSPRIALGPTVAGDCVAGEGVPVQSGRPYWKHVATMLADDALACEVLRAAGRDDIADLVEAKSHADQAAAILKRMNLNQRSEG